MSKWGMVKLGDVCDVVSGFAFDSQKFTDDSTAMPIIRIRDVVRGFTATYTTEKYDKKFVVKKGDLLIGMDGEFNIAEWKDEPALLNQRVCKIFAGNESIFEKYLLYFMPAALKRIEDKTPFVTVKHISIKQIKEILIPLPSIEEQKRIADVLDKASNLIDLRKQQLEKMDFLIKSKFIDMFGDYLKQNINPKILPEVAEFIDYRGRTPEKSNKGIPLITAKNVKDNAFSVEPQEFIPEENYEEIMTRGIPKINDVLFTTEAPLGNVCRIPAIFEKFCVGQRLITMQPINGVIASEFLEYVLLSKEFQDEMWKKSSGSTVKGIRSKELAKLTIPIPPIELQNRFADFVEQIEKQKAVMQQSLEKMETNYKALMQEYFG